MSALNITLDNTLKYVKPVQNIYKNSLGNTLDSDIDNIVAKTLHTKPRLLK